jgi:4,5-dihydroxyphthalate decarboxylase
VTCLPEISREVLIGFGSDCHGKEQVTVAPDNPKVKRLFPNYREVETDYYRRTKAFSIMHTAVLKTGLFQKEPQAAISLYNAYVKAKELNSERL